MKLTKMVLGFVLSMAPLASMASNFERTKLTVPFVDASGKARSGQLDIVVNAAGPGKIYVRDYTASDGDRYPLALRTGFAGTSFIFASQQENANLICSALQYNFGAVVSIVAAVPRGSNFSDITLTKSASGSLKADGSLDQPGISIVKCCQSAPCDGE